MTHGLVALLIVLIVIVGSILTQWCTMLQETISENVWIVVVCGLFGSLIALLQTAKGNSVFIQPLPYWYLYSYCRR